MSTTADVAAEMTKALTQAELVKALTEFKRTHCLNCGESLDPDSEFSCEYEGVICLNDRVDVEELVGAVLAPIVVRREREAACRALTEAADAIQTGAKYGYAEEARRAACWLRDRAAALPTGDRS